MSSRDAWRAMSVLGLVGQLGVIMVACIALGLAAGGYLDSRLHTRPAFMIALILVGVAGGMTAVYRLVMRTVADRPAERDDSDTDSGEERTQ